jgi:hypothetical protein
MKRLLAAALAAGLLCWFSLDVASADPPRPLGGLDLQGYCQSQGYDGVVLDGSAIGGHNVFNNWRCQIAGKNHPFSFEQACRWQYGLQAVQAHPTDKDNAFSWVCYAVGRS